VTTPASPADGPPDQPVRGPRRARLLVAGGLLLVVAVVVAWAVWPDGPPRSDLVGAPVRSGPGSTTTTAPTTTLPGVTIPAPTTTTTTTLPGGPAAQPVLLRIGSIGVEAPVTPVGLAADRSMEVPPADQVGWYRLGVSPASPHGSAVLAAHVDFNGRRGAFFDLRRLPEGEGVVVVMGDGTNRIYRVTQRFQVAKDQAPLADLFRGDGPARLVLITCGGAFDRSIGHYQDNIVVVAEPVGP